MLQTSKIHINSTVAQIEIIYIWKIIRKWNLSICTSFMHEKPSCTCCIGENTWMAFIRAYFGVAFEPLVQMDFNQLNAKCISSKHITCSCHIHASYCCICLCIDCRHRSFSIGPAPDRSRVPVRGAVPPYWSTRQANPLVHSDTILLSRSCSHLLH